MGKTNPLKHSVDLSLATNPTAYSVCNKDSSILCCSFSMVPTFLHMLFELFLFSWVKGFRNCWVLRCRDLYCFEELGLFVRLSVLSYKVPSGSIFLCKCSSCWYLKLKEF